MPDDPLDTEQTIEQMAASNGQLQRATPGERMPGRASPWQAAGAWRAY